MQYVAKRFIRIDKSEIKEEIMNTLLRSITDWVSTKRGMWITIIVWLVLMIGLSAGPKIK